MGGKVLHSCLLLPPLQHWGLCGQVPGDNPYFLLVGEGGKLTRIPNVSSDKVSRPVSSVVEPDPHSFACPGSGSLLGTRSMEIDQNLQIDLVSGLSKKLLHLLRRFFDLFITYVKFFYYVKILLFVTWKV